jgi:3-hydroxybutyryl-CoA dehydrogenase
MSKVCIVGSGFLGTQIGALSARHGYSVSMHDISSDALKNSENSAAEYIKQWIDDRDITIAEGKRIKGRLSYTVELEEAVQRAGLIVEAVVERLEVKRRVFKNLDELCDPSVLISTNSSSIKISYIEDAIHHPERVFNMHFYSYPWTRCVLELMKGTYTSDEVIESAKEFSKSLGVYPLMVLKDSTGFIFNRIWRAIKKESLNVVNDGVASFEDVDRAWMVLYGTKMGPFGMMDRVGLDVVRDIELVYYNESGDPSDEPPKILLDKISKDELGVKTSKGFYSYPNPKYMKNGWLHGADYIPYDI